MLDTFLITYVNFTRERDLRQKAKQQYIADISTLGLETAKSNLESKRKSWHSRKEKASNLINWLIYVFALCFIFATNRLSVALVASLVTLAVIYLCSATFKWLVRLLGLSRNPYAPFLESELGANWLNLCTETQNK